MLALIRNICGRGWDQSGTDLPGTLEASSCQRLKSPSWGMSIDLPVIRPQWLGKHFRQGDFLYS